MLLDRISRENENREKQSASNLPDGVTSVAKQKQILELAFPRQCSCDPRDGSTRCQVSSEVSAIEVHVTENWRESISEHFVSRKRSAIREEKF